MNKIELRTFFYEKTNFSPDASQERAAHRYLAKSKDGTEYPRGDSPHLGVFDAERSRFLKDSEIAGLSFADAMSATKSS